MSNVYDQFDSSVGGESNPYDQFDKPAEPRSLFKEVPAQIYAGATIDFPKMVGQAIQWMSAPGSFGDVGKDITEWAAEREAAHPELQPQIEGRGFAGKALTLGARALAPSVATMVPAALAAPFGGVAMGTAAAAGSFGLFGSSQAQETRENVLKAGGSEADADRAGWINFLIEGGGETAGTIAGYKLLGIGAKALGKSPVDAAIKGATETGVLKPFLKQLPKTVAVEAGTEFGQNFGEAAVEQAFGVPDKDPWVEGAHGGLAALGMTALLAPFGLAGFSMRAKSNERVARALTDPEAPDEARTAAAAIVYDAIREESPEAAKAWQHNATIAIAGRLPITLDETATRPRPLDYDLDKLMAAGSVDEAVGAAMRASTEPVYESDVSEFVGGGLIAGAMNLGPAEEAALREAGYADMERQRAENIARATARAAAAQQFEAEREAELTGEARAARDAEIGTLVREMAARPLAEQVATTEPAGAVGMALRRALGLPETTGAIYDRQDQEGVAGPVGVGQKPVQGQPLEGAGGEAPARGGILQAPPQGPDRLGNEVTPGQYQEPQGALAVSEGPTGAKAATNIPARRQQLFVERGNQRFEVASLEEASRKWDSFRDTTGAGASQIGEGARIVDQTGAEVARISYNGKVWPPGEWKPGVKPLVGEPFRQKSVEEINKERVANGFEPIRETVTIDAEAHQAAISPQNALPEPSKEQILAGNAKLGHPKVAGMDVSIENPAGSIREDKNNTPPKWRTEMKSHYGYIRGTVGFDKDHLDTFVKPGTAEDWKGTVYVVNQNKGNGQFDEHKAMIGFGNQAEARAAYLENYEKGWESRIRSVTPMPLAYFKTWAYDKTTKGPKGGEAKSLGGATVVQSAAQPAPTQPDVVQGAAQEPEGILKRLDQVRDRAVGEGKVALRNAFTYMRAGDYDKVEHYLAVASRRLAPQQMPLSEIVDEVIAQREEAKRRGAADFKAGKNSTPPADLGGLQDAWARGWHQANAAEPVTGVTDESRPTKAALIPTRAGIMVQPLNDKDESVGKPHLAGEKPAAATFGESNKIFTADAAERAREILRKKLGQVTTGLDPEVIQAGIQLAGYYIEGGARSFAAYSAKMVSDLGEAARPYLKSWYLAVRNYPGFDSRGMQSEAELEAAPKPTIMNKEPPGGWTDADKVPEKYRKSAVETAERAVDDDGNPIFRKGERVEIFAGYDAGRHGVISEAQAFTMRSIMIGAGRGQPDLEKHTYTYMVRTDNGAEVNASAREMRPETSKPENVVPDIKVGVHFVRPQQVWRDYQNQKQSATNARERAARAKLQSKKAEWRIEAEGRDKKAAEMLALFHEWKERHPTEAEAIIQGDRPSGGSAPATATTEPATASTDKLGEVAIIAGKHTKTGAAIWTVTVEKRVERDEYLRMNELAGKYGGKYSSFRGGGAVPGFLFKDERAAQGFMGEITGQPSAPAAPKGPEVRGFDVRLPDSPYVYRKERNGQWTWRVGWDSDPARANAVTPAPDLLAQLESALKGEEPTAPQQPASPVEKAADALIEAANALKAAAAPKPAGEVYTEGTENEIPERTAAAQDDRRGDEGERAGDVRAPESGEQGRPGGAREGAGGATAVRGGSERAGAAGDQGDRGGAEGGVPAGSAGVEPAREPTSGRSPRTGARVPNGSAGRNYLAPAGAIERKGSWLDTARRNVEIIALVKDLEAKGELASPEEQALISQYTGFGASEIANGLFPVKYKYEGSGYRNRKRVATRDVDEDAIKPGWKEVYRQLQDLLTPEEMETVKRSTQYAHYTSEPIIRSIWSAVEAMGFTGGKILEPGMGTGLFMVAAPEAVAKASKYVGVEMDHITAAIAKQLLQQHNVIRDSFIDHNFPDNFFDLGIGNPPFAGWEVTADPRYRKNSFKLHDYFFAKTIDRVRPGGLLVFVSSAGTMNKLDDKARQYIGERASLLGAIRLPQTAFKASAGTEVVTDVLFLQKKGPGVERGEEWQKIEQITVKNEDNQDTVVGVNEYFVSHPKMVLGHHSAAGTMYRSNSYTVTPLEGDIEQHFAKAAAENLPTDVYQKQGATKPSEQIQAEAIRHDFDVKGKKEGGVYVADDGEVMQVRSGAGVPITSVMGLSDNEKAWLKDYVPVRDALKQALSDQLNDGPWQQSQAKLKSTYRAFVKKWGRLQEHTITERKVTDEDGETHIYKYKRFKWGKLLKSNVDVEVTLALGMERINEDDTKVEDGDILSKRILNKPVAPQINGVKDALFVHLNDTGRFDLDAIAEKAGMTREKAIAELGDMVYEDPSASWMLADEYLSGNVVRKLQEAEAAAETDSRYQRNVDALSKVQPSPLGPKDIEIRLGANWIPASDVQAFTEEALDEKRKIEYDIRTNQWNVEGDTLRRERSATATWGTADRSPAEILSHILNNQDLTIRKTGADEKSYVDQESTAKVNNIAEKMREAFKAWIWTDAARASRLLGDYNHRFNNLSPRNFDGSYLMLPGLSMRWKPYPHQLRTIARILQTGNTYVAHAVGAGKTMVAIISAMEQKRLGLIKRPMFVVPNHMLEQFANEYMDFYPAARILVADKENFVGDERRRFVAKAALGDWDAVIIKQSSFKLIGTKQETRAAVADDFIAELEAALSDVDDSDRTTRKRLEAQIEAFKQRVEKAAGGDKNITFEEMGTDFLYIDEAHIFRKLDYTTNRQVKGVTPEGSLAAFDLFVKLRHLDHVRPGRNAVLMSGTPVTNTMAEVYTVQRFMDYNTLVEDGMHHFDAWANNFGIVTPEWERDASGTYQKVERFSKFINVPELMMRVRKFMDVLTMEQLGTLVDRPTMKTGRPQMATTQKSVELDDYMRGELATRIKVSKAWKPSADEPGNPDPIINIITDGRLSAIDMRFVRRMGDDKGSKLNLMIDKIIEAYKATKDNEYTDPQTKAPDKLKGGTQIVFSAVGFGEQVAANRGFDVKAWILKRLKASGISSSEVAFMSDYKTDSQKEAMFREMREGRKRILIGSPQNMGTGLNVQKRLAALHYLAPPWYPADIEQPHGRILRQGNQNQDVDIFWYVTEGTYDSSQWGMVRRKGRMIEQSFAGEKGVRAVEDLTEVGMYAMAEAIASGDNRVIQLAEKKANIERFELLRGAHFQEQAQLHSKRSSTGFGLKTARENLVMAEKAIEALGDEYGSWKPIKMQVGGTTYDKPGETGKAVLAAVTEVFASNAGKTARQTVEIGKADGKHSIVAAFRPGTKKNPDIVGLGVKIGDMSATVEYGRDADEWGKVDDVGLGQRLRHTLDEPERLQRQATEEIETGERSLKQINAKLGAPFEYEGQLSQAIAEAADLERELTSEGKASEEDLKKAAEELKQQEQDEIEKYRYSWVRDAAVAISDYEDVALGLAPGESFFVFQRTDEQWSFTHAGSGLSIATGDTKEEAIQAANERAENVGQARLLEVIGKAAKISDEDKAKAREKKGGTAFSRSGAGAMDAARVREIVAPILSAWGNAPQVRVIGSMAEAPDAVRRADEGQRSGGATGEPEAFFWNGTVYMVADGLATPADAVRALLHESLGHYGLRGVYGDRLNQVLDIIASGQRTRVQEKAKQYGLDFSDREQRRTAAEEVLAEIAQSRPESGLVKRAIAAIRQFLRDIGFDLKLSDNDIVQQFIVPARGFVERGRAETTGEAVPAFGRAEKPLTESQFYSRYYQHIDIRGRGGNATENRERIERDGFKSSYVNARPASRGGEPTSIMDRNYRPRSGDTVYLIPKEGIRNTANGPKIKEGWKPQPHEVITITDPARPMYDYYRESLGQDTLFERADQTQTVDRATDRQLRKRGVPAASIMDAERALMGGDRVFIAHDLDERPMEIFSTERLRGYTADQVTILPAGGRGMFSRAPSIASGQTTGDWRDSLSAGAGSFVRDLLHSDAKFGWWARTIGTQQHKAIVNSEFRPVYNETQAFIADTSKYANEAADLAQDILPRVEHFRDFWKKTPKDADLKAAVNALYAGTLFGGGSPMDGRVWTDAELKSGRAGGIGSGLPMFTPLTDVQIKHYRDALAATSKSTEELAKSIVHKLVRQHGLGIDRDLSLTDAVATVNDAIDEQISNRQLALEQAEDNAERAAEIQAEIASWQDLKVSIADITAKAEALTAHGYFPAMRFGQYAIHVVEPDGAGAPRQRYFGLYETQTAANLAARELAKEYPEAEIQRGMMSKEQFRLFQGLNLDALETFAEYITDESGNPIARDPLVQGFLKAAIAERSVLKRHIHRKGISGFSEDLARVLASFVVSSARATSSNYHSAEMLRRANDINAGDVKDEAIKLVRYLQDPQEEAHGIRAFLFTQFLGGSIAHGLVNMTQPFMVTIPYLSQYTTAADAAAKVGQAAAAKPDSLTGAIRDAYERAKKEGVVAPQEIHQLRAETGGMPLGRSLVLRKLSFLWGSIYSITEQFNRTTAFLAAYNVAEAKGLDDPYGFARQAVEQTQFVYNKGNRPNWARGPIGATVFTFKQFSISYLELAKRIYGKDKKAFALMVLMLLAAAGLEGLPFAEDVEDLIDTIGQWMGYATNSKKKLRKWATAVVGPDLAQVALHGISGLPMMPVDVSVRMGLQNLIPGTAMFKPSEKNKARDVLELVGPVGQFVPTEGTMAGRAMERLANGDWFGAVKAGAPVAVQNIAKGEEMLRRGYATDTKGKRVTDVSSGEAVLKMAGLNPASVARESSRIGEVAQDINLQRRTESEIAERWARGRVDNDPAQVRAAMDKLREWNAANPELRIRINMEQIRRRVKEMQTPRAERFVKQAPPEIRSGVREALRQ